MYKRILLKLSGEALADKKQNQTLNCEKLNVIAKEIKKIHNEGVQIGIVVGAGNIWRGKFAEQIGIERAEADYMGMIGTIINSVALASALKNIGVDSEVMSAIDVEPVTNPYNIKTAIEKLEKGVVLVFGGGTGKPYFTTDTAATMRAIEIGADVILMGKYGVDGIYDSDPKVNPTAKLIKDITFDEILAKKLKVMDLTAVELIKDKNIDIRVFNMDDPDNIEKATLDNEIGTTARKGK
ncbi:MAG: UMP kinase [Erysipelotrichaceae bacterium]|jgi:uridylate kinase|nr:UMP kinase [Erysipelotrichaceae bacterium]